MPNTHRFANVTPAVLAQMHAMNGSGLTIDLNRDGRSGTARGKSPLGQLVITFDYDATQAEVKFDIIEKPKFVPTPLVVAEFSQALRRARAELSAGLPPDGL